MVVTARLCDGDRLSHDSGILDTHMDGFLERLNDRIDGSTEADRCRNGPSEHYSMLSY